MTIAPQAVLLASDDPGWLLAAEECMEAAGHVVVGDCPDVVSLLAQAALGMTDVVFVDPRVVRLDLATAARLRRCGVRVVEVGDAPIALAGLRFSGFAEALAWLDQTGSRKRAAPAHRRAKLIVVFGCKGAPGATRAAIQIAQQAAKAAPVSLIDLDDRGGDVGTYLGLPGYPHVLSAVEAIGHGLPWRFTRSTVGLSVLVAPTWSGWTRAVVPGDLSVLFDGLGPCVVDAGSLEAEPNELVRQIVAGATEVVLVGGISPVAQTHLARTRSFLDELAPAIQVINGDDPAASRELAVLLSDPEHQRKSRRGVEQHQDCHRDTRT